MQMLPFKVKETEHTLTLKVSTYPEGNLAIKLYHESFGQLVFWDSLTKNFSGLREKDCGFINTQTTDTSYYDWIKLNDLGERTGQIRLENNVEYIEYLFNSNKLKELDAEGYTYYIRRFRGEIHRRYERVYIVLKRLANHIPNFHYTDYSGWRCLDNSSNVCPLWIEAEDPIHHRHFTFEHRGIILRTTIKDCHTNQTQKFLYHHWEDMASDLLALFSDELPIYAPWSDERRRKSDDRHECSLSKTFNDTAKIRQKSENKKSNRRKKNENKNLS